MKVIRSALKTTCVSVCASPGWSNTRTVTGCRFRVSPSCSDPHCFAPRPSRQIWRFTWCSRARLWSSCSTSSRLFFQRAKRKLLEFTLHPARTLRGHMSLPTPSRTLDLHTTSSLTREPKVEIISESERTTWYPGLVLKPLHSSLKGADPI